MRGWVSCGGQVSSDGYRQGCFASMPMNQFGNEKSQKGGLSVYSYSTLTRISTTRRLHRLHTVTREIPLMPNTGGPAAGDPKILDRHRPSTPLSRFKVFSNTRERFQTLGTMRTYAQCSKRVVIDFNSRARNLV